MTATDTPLPCPFCGEPPAIGRRASSYHPTGEWHSVHCYCGGYSTTAYHGAPTRAEALAKWNRRAPVRDVPDHDKTMGGGTTCTDEGCDECFGH